MKLSEFRKNFPEYDDMSDEELMTDTDFDPEEEDKLTPVLHSIEMAMTGLQEAIKDNKPEVDTVSIDLLKQIKNQLAKLETAINKIDVQPQVIVSPPIVNVPEVVIPQTVIPEPIKEWTFEVVERGPYGNIKTVVARA